MITNSDNRYADLFYSAVVLNTGFNYKVLRDLTDNKAIVSYRDLYNRELINRILKGEFDVSRDSISHIQRIEDSYGKVIKIVNNYARIASENNIEVVSCLDQTYPYNWKVLSGMPRVFYTKGNYELINQMTLSGSAAVVGSRNPSRYACG